jgi:protein SCO1
MREKGSAERLPFKLSRRSMVLMASAGLVVGFATIVAYTGLQKFNARTASGPAAQAGYDFQLTRADGKPFIGSELRGRPFLVFLGFTSCPEICPTTLYELSTRLREGGASMDAILPVFISVDPERDSEEVLARYMTSFDPRIVALRGSLTETDKAVAAFGAYYKKFPIDDDYTVDHTAVVMLYDATGKLQGTLDTHETPDVQRKKLAMLAS